MAVYIQGVEGMQYPRDGTDVQKLEYSYFNQQYATSTHGVDHDMHPSLIVLPKGDADVKTVVNWAREHKVAVAVKSGGHQYSGASSTGGKNIQLDLSNTYKDMTISNLSNSDKTYAFIGVSNVLKDVNAFLKHNGLFVPHGQCAYVGVGGHAQTGGVGQLARGFGLFGDHIRKVRMVCHDGTINEFSLENGQHPEIFTAICGGSPGNFGIITHYVIEVYQAKKYMGSPGDMVFPKRPQATTGPHGLKGIWVYNKLALTELLKYLAKMSDDVNFPRGIDYCVSVLSVDFPIKSLFPEFEDRNLFEKILDRVKDALEDAVIDFLNGQFPAIIVVYAQWCPLDKTDKYTKDVDTWFQKFRDLNKLLPYKSLYVKEFDEDMAKMSGEWIFPKEREFDLPYVKRAYSTNSHTLTPDKWVDAVANRIDYIYNPHFREPNDPTNEDDLRRQKRYLSCKLSVQIQPYGGKYSAFWNNRNNKTSYSWRDTTVVQVLDCFYDETKAENAKELADGWQTKNDAVMNGPKGVFSKQDRRFLWGSHGDWDLSKPEVWKTYYEDEEKYQAIGKARSSADPDGTFTPNPFAVARA